MLGRCWILDNVCEQTILGVKVATLHCTTDATVGDGRIQRYQQRAQSLQNVVSDRGTAAGRSVEFADHLQCVLMDRLVSSSNLLCQKPVRHAVFERYNPERGGVTLGTVASRFRPVQLRIGSSWVRAISGGNLGTHSRVKNRNFLSVLRMSEEHNFDELLLSNNEPCAVSLRALD